LTCRAAADGADEIVPHRAAAVSYLSLACLAAAIVAPALVTLHSHPLPAFYQEWVAFAFGTLAIACLSAHPALRSLAIGRIVLLPALLVGVVLLQAVLGVVAYTEQVMIACLYLLWAAALMVSARVLRDTLGLTRVCEILAGALAVTACISAILAIASHVALHTIAPLERAYANFRQPNLFADYLCLGLASLSLLAVRGRIRWRLVALPAVPMLVALALTQSRSAWVFLVLQLTIALAVGRKRGDTLRANAAVLASGAYLLGLGLAYLALPAFELEALPLQDRLLRTADGVVARLELWQQAFEIFLRSPWLGAGFGQFVHERFWMMRPDEHLASLGLYTHAHNIVLQVLAELGLIAAAALVWLLLRWTVDNVRAARAPEHAWLLGIAGILIVHSLLEFPLWYAGLLAIFALVLGLGDASRPMVTLRMAGWMAGAASLLGALTLATSVLDYRHVERLYAGPQGRALPSTLMRESAGVPTRSLFVPNVELAYTGLLQIDATDAEEALEINGRVLRFMPDDHVVFRQALLLAQAGHAERARKLLRRAAAIYPAYVPEVLPLLRRLALERPAVFAPLLAELDAATAR